MKTKSLILLTLLILLISACSPTTPYPTETSAPTDVPTQLIEITTEPTEIRTSPTSLPLDPISMKVGIFTYLGYAPLYIAQSEGYFEEQGITVELEYFTKISDSITAVASGLIDATAGLYDVSSLNAIARGGNIKYVADEGYIPSEGCDYTVWIVNKDLLASGTLNDLSNLKGKIVSFPRASLAEYAFSLLLKQANLSLDDVQVNELPGPVRLEAATTGTIDIAFLSEPFVSRALATGVLESWNGWNSYMPGMQLGSLYFGPTILDGNIDAGKRFMVAYLKGVRQYNEGKTDRNVALISELTKLTPEEVKQMCWQTFRNDGTMNIQSILEFQKWTVEMGYMDDILTEADIWDPQFIDYANQFLK